MTIVDPLLIFTIIIATLVFLTYRLMIFCFDKNLKIRSWFFGSLSIECRTLRRVHSFARRCVTRIVNKSEDRLYGSERKRDSFRSLSENLPGVATWSRVMAGQISRHAITRASAKKSMHRIVSKESLIPEKCCQLLLTRHTCCFCCIRVEKMWMAFRQIDRTCTRLWNHAMVIRTFAWINNIAGNELAIGVWTDRFEFIAYVLWGSKTSVSRVSKALKRGGQVYNLFFSNI